MANRLDLDDLPIDPDELCEQAETMLATDQEHAGHALLIIGQLDPNQRGDDGTPLYTAAQQTLIVRASTQIQEWRDS